MHSSTIFDRKLCVAVDLQSYGRQDDREQAELQHALVRLLDQAADAARLDRTAWTKQGKGDEELALIPLGANEPRVVDDFVRHLDAALHRFNRNRADHAQMRLRMAIHQGVAYPADNGFAGKGVVVVSRLLNCAAIRAALELPSGHLAVILSRTVFEDLVVEGHTSLRPEQLDQVRVTEKEYIEDAWVYKPGTASRTSVPVSPQRDASTPATDVDRAGRDTGSGAGAGPTVTNHVQQVSGERVVFGFSEYGRG
jgi:hypothetical protein